jgi:hypothetical protein
MLPSWAKSLTTNSIIAGIAINPATKWIIAHSSLRNPNIILILDPNGMLKGGYTYAGIPDYKEYWRNILLGYDSTSSTYSGIIQTRLANNIGYKLFAFSFSSSSSAPSFVWGLNSFYKMGFDDGYSIIFART